MISPFRDNHIANGAYELSLGFEAFITSAGRTKQKLTKGEQIRIPPGQFGLLLSEEEVYIPPACIAFLSIKSKIKLGGLVNVSGFHVDPGFRGRLKFSVYNAGSENIILEAGERTFLIWFADLDRETEETYRGQHQDQVSITPVEVASLQGEVASPGSLSKRIHNLEGRLSRRMDRLESGIEISRNLMIAFISAFLGAALSLWATQSNEGNTSAQQKPAAQQPAVQQPAVQQPAVQQPAVQQPAVQQPAVQQPAVQQPAVQQPMPIQQGTRPN
jgi:dCTP deaminase